MKRICLFIMVFMTFHAGCGKKASDEIDFGTVKKSVYHNDYFGLSMKIPEGWSVQNQETLQEMMNLSGDIVAGDDKVLNAALKASELQTVNLIGLFKHPLGAPVDYNPNILCLAERVRHMPGIKTGKDYHFHSKRLFQSTDIGITFPEEVYTEQIGGVDFDVMTLTMPNLGQIVNQKQYATVMKGYALIIIASFSSGEEKAELDGVLESVRFRK